MNYIFFFFSLSAAPNLKGRPRKKKPSISLRRDSQSQGQGSELKGHCQTSPTTKETGTTEGRNSAKVQFSVFSHNFLTTSLIQTLERFPLFQFALFKNTTIKCRDCREGGPEAVSHVWLIHTNSSLFETRGVSAFNMLCLAVPGQCHSNLCNTT